MKTMVMISGVAVCLLWAAQAVASPCSDRIISVEKKVKEKAEAAMSASGGGQGVSASRQARAIQDDEKTQDQARSADEDLMRTEAAGEGGNDILEAQVALTRAKQLDADGDDKGCQEALAEVERKLSPPEE